MDKVKAAVLVLALVVIAGPRAWAAADAAELNSLFNEGCDLYEASEFEGAQGIFESLVSAGVKDPAVYYNLGNCYYQLGEIGKAIISYRHARMLAPRDEEIKANLAFIRSSIGFKDTTSTVGLGGLTKLPGEIASPKEWQTVFYIAYYAAALCFLVILFVGGAVRRYTLRVLVVSLVLTIASWVFAERGRAAFSAGNQGAVITDRSEFMSGPGAAFEELARLPDGVEVTLRSRTGIWVEVSLPTGEVGWLREEDIQTL
jgi:tetratricopeptide (TPR) repeat protein